MEYLKTWLGVFSGQTPGDGVDFGALALASLDETPQIDLKVYDVQKLHENLIKLEKSQALGAKYAGVADAFKAKAREMFPYSTYFKA